MSKGQWKSSKAKSRLARRRRILQYVIDRLIREGRAGKAAVIIDRRSQR